MIYRNIFIYDLSISTLFGNVRNKFLYLIRKITCNLCHWYFMHKGLSLKEGLQVLRVKRNVDVIFWMQKQYCHKCKFCLCTIRFEVSHVLLPYIKLKDSRLLYAPF
jgi:hypothetical protein